MKFSLEASADANQIHSYSNDHIVIKPKDETALLQLDASLIVTPGQIISDWHIHTLSEIKDSDIHYLQQFEPEIIILAYEHTEYRLFSRLTTQFISQNSAVELMSLGAACRSYNLLVSDGRKVLLAIPFANQ